MVGFGIVAVVTAAAFLFDRMSRQKCLRHMFKCRQTEIGLFVCGYLPTHLYKSSARAHFFCILFKVILSFLIENVYIPNSAEQLAPQICPLSLWLFEAFVLFYFN